MADYIMKSVFAFSLFISMSALLGACSNKTLLQPASHATTSLSTPKITVPAMTGDYRLAAGDKLDVVVEGVKDHSGKFDINGAGYASMPFIGNIKAAGFTLPEFRQKLTQALSKYVRKPSVRVRVLNYRPFYIQGEVRKGGQYAYREGLDIRRAVAIAGGYTYRAVKSYVFIQRAGDTKERKISLNKPLMIQPGDNIRVPERFF